MRKGDSHLELLIYLASILPRQSPGGMPCRGRHRAPWPAVLPWFWPWQRSPLCCLTRSSPGYYQVCDLSMCGSLTRPSTTLCLGRCWNTPVYPLIVCPSMGREGGRVGSGDTWTGEHGNQDTRLGNWELFEGQERKTQKPAACEWDRKLLSVSNICVLAERELHQLSLMWPQHLHLYH